VKTKILTRFLSILAAIGLLFAPLVTPAVQASTPVAMTSSGEMGSMEMGGMAMAMPAATPGLSESMGCCPPPRQHVPDCPKDCPWAAICMVQCLPNIASAGSAATLLSWLPASMPAVTDRNRDRMPDPPPPRPPRS
jgi:hypothetical protein